MTQYISGFLIEKLFNKQLIQEDEIDVYRFGLELLIVTISKVMGLLIIGLAFGIISEIIFFTLFFSGLRIQTGGYHAKTPMKCFLGTIGLLFMSIFLVKIIPIEYELYFILISIITSIVMVMYYAPVENENRPLSKKEKIIYKNRSIATVILGSIIVLIFVCLNSEFVYFCKITISGFLFQSLTLINKDEKREHEVV